MRAELEAIGARLSFDEKKHAYAFNGQALNAVTSVIKTLDKSGPLMAWAVKLAKEGRNYRHVSKEEMGIGTYCHGIAENWARKKVGLSPAALRCPSPEAQLLSSGFPAWLDRSGLEPILPEVMLYHPEWLLAGTCDLVARWHGHLVVVDLKTTSKGDSTYDEWPLQVAAYRGMLAYHGFPGLQGLILRLPKDGSDPSFLPLGDDDRDLEAFLALLKVYRWVNRKNEPKSRVIAAAEKFMTAKA